MTAHQPIPYSTQQISDDDIAAVIDVLRSPWLTQGPAVPRFEQAFAARHGVSHAVAVSNATAGLHIACLALGAGPGKTVWTSPNSFVASANCALYCGAEVDFVDIDPLTRNMCGIALAEKLERAERDGKLPAIVIPVHFAGLACDLVPMRALADRYGFKILEDASHAVGASYNDEPIGSRFSDASVFSFHPVKVITTGEGGMVTTQDAQLARSLQLLRSHGVSRNPSEMTLNESETEAWYYEQSLLGFNYRMTDIHAALGVSQLERLDKFQAARERLAEQYDKLLSGFPLLLPARKPSFTAQARSSWHLYVVEIDTKRTDVSRARVFEAMRNVQIAVNVHYIPIHMQPYYRAMGFVQGAFPAAERYYQRALSLPLFPSLSTEQQQRVVDGLQTVLFA